MIDGIVSVRLEGQVEGQCAYRDVPLIVVSHEDDHVIVLTPLGPAQVSEFANLETPEAPLSQVVVHPSRSDLGPTVNNRALRRQ